MTANQINYAKLKEDIRTHKVYEELESRKTKASEVQAAASEWQAETAARNAETNLQNAYTNQSAVNAQWYGAQANAEYQRTMAQVSQAQQAETAYHNRVSESNDILKHGQDVTAHYYEIQKNTEVKQGEIKQKQSAVELQTRTQLLTTLINAIGSGASKVLMKSSGVKSILGG